MLIAKLAYTLNLKLSSMSIKVGKVSGFFGQHEISSDRIFHDLCVPTLMCPLQNPQDGTTELHRGQTSVQSY